MDGVIGIVVLGMGRSGTSSLTRMFVAAGFFAGREQDLMPATEANPTGHWENMCIWRVNEEVLGKLGGTWFDPPPVTVQMAARHWAAPLLHAEVERIAGQSSGAPIVIKDPRIGVMMPLWGPILADHLHPVLVVRDPVEIARSLLIRDGTPIPFALATWELHMTALLDHFQDRLVTVAPYGQLVSDESVAPSIVEATAAHVDAGLTQSLRPVDGSAAFDRTLYRNRAASGDHYEHLTSRQLDLWRLLSSLPAGDQHIEAPPELRAPSEASEAAVRAETERIASNVHRAQLARDLDEQRGQNDGLQRDFAAEREQSNDFRASLQAQREQNSALKDLLASEQQRSANLLVELQAQRDRALATTESLAQAERWLASIQSSVSWRITRPLRAAKRYLR